MKPTFIWITMLAVAFSIIMSQPTTAMGDGTWINGTVTKKAWKDNQVRVEVNGVKYMVMPDAKIYLSVNTRPDAYDEKTVSIRTIKKGQKVAMMTLGHNIYQIIALK